MKGIIRNNFFTKLFHWEYWPFKLVYLPVFFYWLWCYLRTGSPFYFIASNPGIRYGGMLYDPKYPVLRKFDPELIPLTALVPMGSSLELLTQKVQELNLNFPMIVKPDIGERGLKVELVRNRKELEEYHQKGIKFDYLVQEYITLPLEVGVFYYRYPDQEEGRITSIVVKEMLQVTGDGRSTLRELVDAYPRARMQMEKLEKRLPEELDSIPERGKVIELESIGNHNRGTTFLNGNELINDQLNKVFDGIAKQVDGFYYGRFDLKCSSVEELNRGEGIKILELNGAKSEPAHIYQPGYSIFKAYASIFSHWSVMLKISRMNRKAGHMYMKFPPSYKVFKEYQAYLKMVKSL